MITVRPSLAGAVVSALFPAIMVVLDSSSTVMHDLLSPNPQIMNNARERMGHSPIYSDVVEHLIGKLLITDNLSSNDHKECLADLTTKFFDKHQKFVDQTGILDSDTIWYTAVKSDFIVECR
jgi:hypothetical protein